MSYDEYVYGKQITARILHRAEESLTQAIRTQL